MGGGALVFKGGYHARVQKHGKRVVFQGEARTVRAVFRVSKAAKIKKKDMFFRLIENTTYGYMFFTYYKYGINI